MIGRIAWLAGLAAIAVITVFVQLDRQAEANPALAPLVPQPFRAHAQTFIAAAAAEGKDSANALEEAERLIRRRPVPAEHLTILALAQTKAGQVEQAALSIQIAGQRGWREPISQEAVLRLALAAGDMPEATRRYAAMFLRKTTPDDLLLELGPQVFGEPGEASRSTMTDILVGAERWYNLFPQRGVRVMPAQAFAEIAQSAIARGVQFDCTQLARTVGALRQQDEQAADKLIVAAAGLCPQLAQPS